jgi:hypothetical protein
MPTDQVILARRRSWPLTMRTAFSFSQSMKISEHFGARHLAVGKIHLPGAAWLSAQRHRCAAGLLVLD